MQMLIRIFCICYQLINHKCILNKIYARQWRNRVRGNRGNHCPGNFLPHILLNKETEICVKNPNYHSSMFC